MNFEVHFGKYEGQKGLMIGNGSSRKDVDLDELAKKYDVTFGCNALYLDYFPDFLMIQNREIFQECLDQEVWKKSRLVVLPRRNFYNPAIHKGRIYFFTKRILKETTEISDGLWNKSVGFKGIGYMLRMGFTMIGMIGMDMDNTNIYWKRHLSYRKGIHHRGEGERFQEMIQNFPQINWVNEG